MVVAGSDVLIPARAFWALAFQVKQEGTDCCSIHDASCRVTVLPTNACFLGLASWLEQEGTGCCSSQVIMTQSTGPKVFLAARMMFQLKQEGTGCCSIQVAMTLIAGCELCLRANALCDWHPGWSRRALAAAAVNLSRRSLWGRFDDGKYRIKAFRTGTCFLRLAAQLEQEGAGCCSIQCLCPW